MPWSFRKSTKVGPFRLNFSKAGVGVSVGVKGARVGVNSRNTYIQVGRGGIYYRKHFSHKNTTNKRHDYNGVKRDYSYNLDYANNEEALQAQLELSSTHELTQQIDNASSPSWMAYVIGLCAFGLLLQVNLFFAIFVALLLFFVIRYISRRYRRVALNYELDDLGKNTVGSFQQILVHLSQSSRIWYIRHQEFHGDWKRNAGAAQSIKRLDVEVTQGKLPNVLVNVPVYGLRSSRGLKCFFLPDALYVHNRGRYGVFPYEELDITISEIQFVESERVPQDAEFLHNTWRYVNKNGGPDRRFNNNRQYPVLNYGQLFFETQDGLTIEFQISNSEINQDVGRALKELINVQKKYLK